jgi:hypothetical protein
VWYPFDRTPVTHSDGKWHVIALALPSALSSLLRAWHQGDPTLLDELLPLARGGCTYRPSAS